MKKLPLVAALAAASLCSAALAQSSVSISGRLYPYLVDEKGSGPTAPGTTGLSSLAGTLSATPGVGAIKGMQSGNSRISFRGTEDLGGGLKVFFQLETQVGVDNGVGGATGQFWNRDTFVGMNGGFGEVRLGVMDTIFKTYGDTIGFLGVSSGTPMSTSNILRKPGFGTSNNARFHERRPNSIAYETKEMGGFTFGVQVATSEGTPAVAANPATGSSKTWSFGVKWDNGPLYLALAHEIHDNWYGGSAQAPSSMRNTGAADNVDAKDKATQFTVEWRINKSNKVEFDWIRKEYKEDAIVANRFKSYTNDAWQVVFESRLSDKWRVSGHYVNSAKGSCERVNAVCTTDGLEGKKYMIGGGYYFSRRTWAYAVANQVKNGKAARFSAASEFGSPNPGEDFRQLIMGVAHSF